MFSMIPKWVNKVGCPGLTAIMMIIRGAYSVINMVISNALVKEKVKKFP